MDEYFTKISESKLLSVPGLQPLRKELLDSARTYYEEFAREHSDDPTVQADLAEAWYRVAYITNFKGSGQEALPLLSRALTLYRNLAKRHPGVVRYPYKVAMCLNDLGILQSSAGSFDEAARSHQEAREIREKIAKENPTVAEYQKELALSYGNLSGCRYDAGRMFEALDYEAKGRDLLETLVREYPAVADYRSRLAGSYNGMGRFLRDIGRTGEALRMHLRAVDLLEQLVREDHAESLELNGRLDFQSHLAASYQNIGFIQCRVTDQVPEALQSHRRALSIHETLARENPTVDDYQDQLAWCLTNIGLIQDSLGQVNEALQTHQRHPFNSRSARTPAAFGCLVSEPGRVQQLVYRPVAAESRPGGRCIAVAPEGADDLRRAAGSNSIDPYNLACIQAICGTLVGLGKSELSPEEKVLKEQFTDRAMAMLRGVSSGGFHNADFIHNDPDFASIRSRDDFRNLIDELRSKAKAEQTVHADETNR